MKFYVGGVGGRDERGVDVAGEEDAVRVYLDEEVVTREGRVGVYVRDARRTVSRAYSCEYRDGAWQTTYCWDIPLGTVQRPPSVADEVRRAKANVRDAAVIACHEARADFEAHGWIDRATGARAAAEAIAALDLEAL